MTKKEQLALTVLLTFVLTNTAEAHMPHVESWKKGVSVGLAGIAAFAVPYAFRKKVKDALARIALGFLGFIIAGLGALFFSFASSF